MAEQETRIKPLEWYKNLNKVTLVGALGVAGVSAVVPALHPLVVPSLLWAGSDAFQIVVIDKINKKKPQEHVVYQAKQGNDERIPMDAFTPKTEPKATIIDLDAFRKTAIRQLKAA
ncbi:MAG: hypothetical protein HY426_04080 [Candidatus Levybacteria bacterium]|nr:hypothetical protein [Candidatus Levybacteria bacterium]